MFDVVFVFGGVKFVEIFMKNGRVVYYVCEVFGYLKIVVVMGEFVKFFEMVF